MTLSGRWAMVVPLVLVTVVLVGRLAQLFTLATFATPSNNLFAFAISYRAMLLAIIAALVHLRDRLNDGEYNRESWRPSRRWEAHQAAR